MKLIVYTIIGICLSVSLTAQENIQDETQQARVHFMNEAKVSYVASAELYQPAEPTSKKPEIPAEIKDSFDRLYKEAKKNEWTIKEDRYKVNFQFNGHKMFTYLDRHGLWIKSFTRLVLEDIPEPITSYLSSEYPEYELTKFYLKDTPEGQSYTVAARSVDEYVWLEFDENGALLNSPAS
jgi:hypothetical protein